MPTVPRFNGTLIWSFALLGSGLVVGDIPAGACRAAAAARLRRAGAHPRRQARKAWKDNFPAEIAPLATELNSLIEHSAEVVGRARTHVSNLAHFLKTPLTRAGQRSRPPSPAAGGPGAPSGRRHAPPGRSLSGARPRRRRAQCAGQPHGRGAGAGRSRPRADPHPCRARHRHRCRLSRRPLSSAASARTWKRWRAI